MYLALRSTMGLCACALLFATVINASGDPPSTQPSDGTVLYSRPLNDDVTLVIRADGSRTRRDYAGLFAPSEIDGARVYTIVVELHRKNGDRVPYAMWLAPAWSDAPEEIFPITVLDVFVEKSQLNIAISDHGALCVVECNRGSRVQLLDGWTRNAAFTPFNGKDVTAVFERTAPDQIQLLVKDHRWGREEHAQKSTFLQRGMGNTFEQVK